MKSTKPDISPRLLLAAGLLAGLTSIAGARTPAANGQAARAPGRHRGTDGEESVRTCLHRHLARAVPEGRGTDRAQRHRQARQRRHRARGRRDPCAPAHRAEQLRAQHGESLWRLLRVQDPCRGRRLRPFRSFSAGGGQGRPGRVHDRQPGDGESLVAAGQRNQHLQHHQHLVGLPEPLLQQPHRQDVGRMDPHEMAGPGRQPQRRQHRIVRLRELLDAALGDPDHPGQRTAERDRRAGRAPGFDQWQRRRQQHAGRAGRRRRRLGHRDADRSDPHRPGQRLEAQAHDQVHGVCRRGSRPAGIERDRAVVQDRAAGMSLASCRWT